MKERSPAAASSSSSALRRVLAACASQAKDYGRCIAEKVPEIEHNMCSKEFLALRSCMQTVMQGGLGSPSALSHAYVQHPPLRCDIPDIRGLFYDDANKFLIAPTADRILYWKIAPSTPPGPPNSDPVNDGPVLSVRYSLDQKAIGIQRSNHEVEFRNRETGQTCSKKWRADSETILGFFWTDCPTCDVIIIKTSGLDLFAYEPQSNGLHLVDSKKFNVSWYLYTHESRLILLASGMQCTLFTGYQFSAGGIVKLPKFEMTMTKSEANNKPVLAADDVHTLDRVSMTLNLYRFYRDAVVQQGTLPTYSSRIAVSAVDNIIMVHQIDAKVVILYDVFMDSYVPISAPLPLLVRGLPSNNKQSAQPLDSQSSAFGGTLYGEGWNFLIPDLVCDVENGLLWRLHVDLEAIAASTSDAPSILEFLQRRKSDPNMVKNLSLAIVRTIILERRPVTMVSKAMDVVLDSYARLMKMGGSPAVRRTSEQNQQSGVQPTVNPDSASGDGNRPVQSNSEVDNGIANLAAQPDRTLVSKAGLKAPPNLYVMMTTLLARSNRYHEITLFVSNKILEPSKELAMQLMELGREHSPTRKLGVDMLRERGLHHDYVTALLQDGYHLEALRYARKYKVITVQPALFLEKAVAINSAQNLASTLSFFSEFTPTFKTTSDYGRYRHILSEMI
uniref:Uncharacterized protein n=1 Tax=Leersia perrieri TaxID=77586 RepID=A0A0D9XJF8_9ORYZ